MKSNMYNQYYTASDVTLMIRNPLTDRSVTLDKAVAIAYTHSISSIPIYALGSKEPVFFSTGNSIVQGQLDTAFSHSKYLTAIINYLVSSTAGKQFVMPTDKKGLDNLSEDDLKNILTKSTVGYSSKSLINVNQLFDIIVTFNNDDVTSNIIIKGVKFGSYSQAISSSDESALIDRHTFQAKTIE